MLAEIHVFLVILNTAGDLADVDGIVFDLRQPVPLTTTIHNVSGGTVRPQLLCEGPNGDTTDCKVGYM